MKKKQFSLGHVTLYAKGWYNSTNDIWHDLSQMLQLDDYTPYDNQDIWSVIVRRFNNECDINIVDMLDSISPDNCWKIGYKTNNQNWGENYLNNPIYDLETASLYYIMSQLRFKASGEYKRVVPKYTKLNPRPKGICLKHVIDVFNNSPEITIIN